MRDRFAVLGHDTEGSVSSRSANERFEGIKPGSLDSVEKKPCISKRYRKGIVCLFKQEQSTE